MVDLTENRWRQFKRITLVLTFLWYKNEIYQILEGLWEQVFIMISVRLFFKKNRTRSISKEGVSKSYCYMDADATYFRLLFLNLNFVLT